MRNWIVDDLLVEVGIFAAAVLARIVDEELALGDAGGAEGVGLDDVRAGLKKAAMDVADHLRLGEREEVAVVQQVLGGVLEALAADVRFRHAVGADGGAHRAIDDGDAALENLFQRMWMAFGHKCLMVLHVQGIQEDRSGEKFGFVLGRGDRVGQGQRGNQHVFLAHDQVGGVQAWPARSRGRG